MFCPKCGKENPDGAGFCKECGASLKREENVTTKEGTSSLQKAKKRGGLAKAAVVLVSCLAIAIVAIFVKVKFFSPDKSGDYVAYVKNTGELCTLDVTKKEMEPITYGASEVTDIRWIDWWMNWGDMQQAGRPEDIEKLLKYSSTTQMSTDGKYVCYASNYTGLRAYRLEVQRIGKPKKEAAVISDDVIMHRIVGKNKIVWLKYNEKSLYVSDLKGKKKEKIADNVAYAPFFVDEGGKYVLWYADGDNEPCVRDLDLKDKVKALNWDQVNYISADMKTIIGTQGDDLKVLDRFKKEEVLAENTTFDEFIIVGRGGWYNADYGHEEFQFVKKIGESSELFCQIWNDEENHYDIYHYKKGKLKPFKENCTIIGEKGELLVYRDGEESGDSVEEEVLYLWVDGKETRLEAGGLGPVYFSEDNSKGWAGRNVDGLYTLLEFNVKDADGKLSLLAEEAYILAIGEDSIYYTRPDEMGVNLELYCNEDLVDSEGTTGFQGKDGKFYYRTGQDSVFILKVYDGEETAVIDDQTVEVTALENGNAAVVTCQNYEMEDGDLFIYTPDGEKVSVDSGVLALADTDMSVRSIKEYR